MRWVYLWISKKFKYFINMFNTIYFKTNKQTKVKKKKIEHENVSMTSLTIRSTLYIYVCVFDAEAISCECVKLHIH